MTHFTLQSVFASSNGSIQCADNDRMPKTIPFAFWWKNSINKNWFFFLLLHNFIVRVSFCMNAPVPVQVLTSWHVVLMLPMLIIRTATVLLGNYWNGDTYQGHSTKTSQLLSRHTSPSWTFNLRIAELKNPQFRFPKQQFSENWM